MKYFLSQHFSPGHAHGQPDDIIISPPCTCGANDESPDRKRKQNGHVGHDMCGTSSHRYPSKVRILLSAVWMHNADSISIWMQILAVVNFGPNVPTHI